MRKKYRVSYVTKDYHLPGLTKGMALRSIIKATELCDTVHHRVYLYSLEKTVRFGGPRKMDLCHIHTDCSREKSLKQD